MALRCHAGDDRQRSARAAEADRQADRPRRGGTDPDGPRPGRNARHQRHYPFLGPAIEKSGMVCRSSASPAVLGSQTRKRRTNMPYVDGFIVAVPKAKLEAYKNLARAADRKS